MPREELWFCMRESGVAEKYVRLVQDKYESNMTVVRCTVGVTDMGSSKIGLDLILFAVVMDKLTD